MYTVFLLRHGQTDWNRSGILQGNTDIALNFTGRRQMVRLSRVSSDLTWERAYCSPLRRARESHAILDRSRSGGCEVVDGLAEMNFGALQGLSRCDLEQRYSASVSAWWTEPWSARFPDGESLEDVDRRVARMIDVVLSDAASQVLISAHGVVNRLILMRLMGWERSAFWSFEVRNASLMEVDVSRRLIRGILHGEQVPHA